MTTFRALAAGAHRPRLYLIRRSDAQLGSVEPARGACGLINRCPAVPIPSVHDALLNPRINTTKALYSCPALDRVPSD